MLRFPSRADCERILAKFPALKIAIFGDFFLDEYLCIDTSLEERSVETGLAAHQVVSVQSSPGAAGTVAKNLAALGVGEIWAIGAIGDDGRGFELVRHLENLGVRTDNLLKCENHPTPTYTKPIRIPQAARGNGSAAFSGNHSASDMSLPVELERLDILHREGYDDDVVDELLARLAALAGKVDGVVVLDQVAAANVGLIQERARQVVADIAGENESTTFVTDSRNQIGKFDNVILKANRQEILQTIGTAESTTNLSDVAKAARKQALRTGKQVFTTCGELGMLVTLEEQTVHVPAHVSEGPIDITGAGDSATAALLASLCAESDPIMAAVIANAAASISIEQIGATGVAKPQEILARIDRFLERNQKNPLEFALRPIAS